MASNEEIEPYAWIITRDYLDEANPGGQSVVGVSGPSGSAGFADLDHANKGAQAKGIVFDLYDDDGVHYVRGRIVFKGWDDGVEPYEDVLVGPLRDYGTPGMGATLCKFPGHPAWTLEW